MVDFIARALLTAACWLTREGTFPVSQMGREPQLQPKLNMKRTSAYGSLLNTLHIEGYLNSANGIPSFLGGNFAAHSLAGKPTNL